MSAGIKDIAAHIRAARQAKALTQKELGKRVGLPQSHISKIEQGIVDLQLSSLTEIARALDLDVKLVPLKAIPAVDGAVRAHSLTAETSRALKTLTTNAQLAERIKINYPDLSQADTFQRALTNVSKIKFDAAQLKALQEALRPTMKLQKWILDQGGAAEITKHLEKATKSLENFRNIQVHAPRIEGPRQLPAYRLEEDDL